MNDEYSGTLGDEYEAFSARGSSIVHELYFEPPREPEFWDFDEFIQSFPGRFAGTAALDVIGNGEVVDDFTSYEDARNFARKHGGVAIPRWVVVRK